MPRLSFTLKALRRKAPACRAMNPRRLGLELRALDLFPW